MIRYGAAFALCLTIAGCAGHRPPPPAAPLAAGEAVELFDAARGRPIPVMVYGRPAKGHAKPLAIISHGYGGTNTAYSFLAADLVRRGFVVASIQHVERPDDPPMATAGNLALLRRPVWQIGADSIVFVVRELRAERIANRQRVVLLGHSNGGDMTMLFATTYPHLTRVALSLDNRRMPLPRVGRPRICSIRSVDQNADPGVLPTRAEQAAFGMLVETVAVKHNDMWDGASESARHAMLALVSRCLDRRP